MEHYALIEKNIDFINFILKNKDQSELLGPLQQVLACLDKNRFVGGKQERYKTADFNEMTLADFYQKLINIEGDVKNILAAFAQLQNDTRNCKYLKDQILMKASVLTLLSRQEFKQFNDTYLVRLVEDLRGKNTEQQYAVITEYVDKITSILQNFVKSRFGLKNLPDFDEKRIDSLNKHLMYLANISGQDSYKKNIIIFFLLMHLRAMAKIQGRRNNGISKLHDRQYGQ